MSQRPELVWEADGPPALNRPIMVLALTGLFDISSVATQSIEHLLSTHKVASSSSGT